MVGVVVLATLEASSHHRTKGARRNVLLILIHRNDVFDAVGAHSCLRKRIRNLDFFKRLRHQLRLPALKAE